MKLLEIITANKFRQMKEKTGAIKKMYVCVKTVAPFLADFRALCLGDGKQNNIGAIQTKVREQ